MEQISLCASPSEDLVARAEAQPLGGQQDLVGGLPLLVCSEIDSKSKGMISDSVRHRPKGFGAALAATWELGQGVES